MELKYQWDEKILDIAWEALSKVLTSTERTELQDKYDELLNKYHEAKEQGPWLS